jgi:pimeloyl-ACP methyl ester carboxylesterase
MEYRKSGDGPLLIYLPGLEGTGRLFFRQEPDLNKRFQVITFPLRSSPPFDYEDLTQDLLEILNQEKTERATIVGESFGGTIALHFASKHPAHVEHLILVNTFPYYRRRILLQLGKLFVPIAYHPLTRWARNLILPWFLKNKTIDQTAIQNLLQCTWSQSPDTYRNRVKLIQRHDLRANLEKISVPVTIVAAAKDRVSPSLKEAELMHRCFPNSRIVVLPEHGHICLVSTQFSLSTIFD